jgi:murein L,D-transpeptidase YcbB/YkuD
VIAAPWVMPVLNIGPSPVARAIEADLSGATPDRVAQFYRARGYRPVWVRRGAAPSDAALLVATLRKAGDDDLNPATYRPDAIATALAQANASPASLARADIALSRTFVAYVGDLHRPPAFARLQYVDPAVRLSPTDPAVVLAEAARAPSLSAALSRAQRMNPIYAAIRQAVDVRRRASGLNDRTTLVLEANLERARSLPADLGARYIFVDPAAQQLEFHEAGRPTRTMPVIVGKPDNQTPSMIGVIRFALFNPYWNVPPDLVRERLAPKVVDHGPGAFAGYQALSGWSPDATVLAPQTIDWPAVASGRALLRVRQFPGADNMMGRVKFMLPNPLGVYLHDTPEKGLFGRAARTDSAGCVRLKDAGQLVVWLWGRSIAYDPNGPPDQRLDLSPPTPVYIVYLTVAPGPNGLSFLPDIYARDPSAIANLGRLTGG